MIPIYRKNQDRAECRNMHLSIVRKLLVEYISKRLIKNVSKYPCLMHSMASHKNRSTSNIILGARQVMEDFREGKCDISAIKCLIQ